MSYYTIGRITQGFVTHADREVSNLNPTQIQNIIVIEETSAGAAWLSRNSLSAISKADAQAAYDSFVDDLIENWSSDMGVLQPIKETLP
jgi:hypothetical protein